MFPSIQHETRKDVDNFLYIFILGKLLFGSCLLLWEIFFCFPFSLWVATGFLLYCFVSLFWICILLFPGFPQHSKKSDASDRRKRSWKKDWRFYRKEGILQQLQTKEGLTYFLEERGWRNRLPTTPTSGPSSNPRPSIICDLSFVLVLVLASRVFCGFSSFIPSPKPSPNSN